MTDHLRHAACELCWYDDICPEDPFRIHVTVPDRCCYCGVMTLAGIYMTASGLNPKPYCSKPFETLRKEVLNHESSENS